MSLSSLEKVEKLKKIDEIIFDLKPDLLQDKAFSEIGKIMIELAMIKNNNKEEIVQAYNRDVSYRLHQYLKNNKQEKNEVILCESTLRHYEKLKREDPEVAELAQTCRQDFIKYSCIVLSFNNQINALRKTKKGEQYREAAKRIDNKRTEVHNSCLADLKIINRISKMENLKPFIETNLVKPTRTDYGAAIIKLCYNRMISTLNSLF